jgi:glyoxylase-like metal-dependent hydrolase (beta-lactamase superfamily II)
MRGIGATVLAAFAVIVSPVAIAPFEAKADDRVFDVAAGIDDPQWRVVVVEYARSRDVPVRRLVVGAPAAERVDMSWYFLVAVGHGRVVLIDTGTDVFARRPRSDLRARWSIAEARTVVEALARVGLAPEQVTDIVLTHFHWDHVGGVASFPEAVVHAVAAEWRRVPARLRHEVAREGRMRSIAPGGGEIFPGLSAYRSGRHTAHHVMVRIACADRAVIIASDAAYLYRNMERRRPVTVTSGEAANLAEVGAAVAEVGLGNVVPGHDPAVFDRFPTPVSGVAAICR